MVIISRIETDRIEEDSARIKCRTDERTKCTVYVTDNTDLPINDWITVQDTRDRRSHRLTVGGLETGTEYSFFFGCVDCDNQETAIFTTAGSTEPDPPNPDPPTQDFAMDNRYFDGNGGQYGLWEDTRELDITGPTTVMVWFRRDVFNLQQFFLSKGHWGDRVGWRFMVKQTKPPYQYEQIQVDVADGSELNYYKSNKGVTDSLDHFAAFVFNPNRVYVDSKEVDTHGFVCLDGDCDDYYMARSNNDVPAISKVKPYRAPLYLGRHFCDDKFYFCGMIYEAKIIKEDIGKSGVTDYYNATKVAYNTE